MPQKSVTHVSERLLPMSQVYTPLGVWGELKKDISYCYTRVI